MSETAPFVKFLFQELYRIAYTFLWGITVSSTVVSCVKACDIILDLKNLE